MSEDHQSVNLDMLKSQLAAAEVSLRDAIRKRAVAAGHLRERHQSNGHPLAASILGALDILSNTPSEQAFMALQAWFAGFPVDMASAGAERVLVSGSEPLKTWDQARALFGHQIAMTFDADAREVLTRCLDDDSCLGVVGWPTQAGSGQWWPILNESKYHSLRVVGCWPVLGKPLPSAAIIAHGPLPLHMGRSTLLIAHDDHHKVGRIFTDIDLPVTEMGRARSLVLLSVPARVAEDDARLKAARTAGLDGLRVVGALPLHIPPAG